MAAIAIPRPRPPLTLPRPPASSLLEYENRTVTHCPGKPSTPSRPEAGAPSDGQISTWLFLTYGWIRWNRSGWPPRGVPKNGPLVLSHGLSDHQFRGVLSS